MKMRVHQPSEINRRSIGDIITEELRRHVDQSELACHLAVHEPGSADDPQLIEMWLQPKAIIVPHHHDTDEIYYVVEGELTWGDRHLGAGGSLFIPAGVVYSFRAGGDGARLLNFRPTADHSFHPA